ncbi:helix-turn-helix domain-containing protein [Stenotrophomonas sepilia]
MGIETVAARLSMSKRTLQRRLAQDGGNFCLLVNDTREALARHYLTQTELSAGEIGFLLRFEDPNSFFRAFHDWTGTTPEAVRRAVH